LKKNIFLKSIKDDHADGHTSGSGLIRSIMGDLELPSQKNRTFITIWTSWFSYEFPLLIVLRSHPCILHVSLVSALLFGAQCCACCLSFPITRARAQCVLPFCRFYCSTVQASNNFLSQVAIRTLDHWM